MCNEGCERVENNLSEKMEKNKWKEAPENLLNEIK